MFQFWKMIFVFLVSLLVLSLPAGANEPDKQPSIETLRLYRHIENLEIVPNILPGKKRTVETGELFYEETVKVTFLKLKILNKLRFETNTPYFQGKYFFPAGSEFSAYRFRNQEYENFYFCANRQDGVTDNLPEGLHCLILGADKTKLVGFYQRFVELDKRGISELGVKEYAKRRGKMKVVSVRENMIAIETPDFVIIPEEDSKAKTTTNFTLFYENFKEAEAKIEFGFYPLGKGTSTTKMAESFQPIVTRIPIILNNPDKKVLYEVWGLEFELNKIKAEKITYSIISPFSPWAEISSDALSVKFNKNEITGEIYGSVVNFKYD